MGEEWDKGWQRSGVAFLGSSLTCAALRGDTEQLMGEM